MHLTKKITNRGKKMVMNPTVMRWISDDRVMKAAEGMLGARTRVRAAWKVLIDGHSLPAVDLLDDSRWRAVRDEANGTVRHGNAAATASELKSNGTATAGQRRARRGRRDAAFVDGFGHAVLDQALANGPRRRHRRKDVSKRRSSSWPPTTPGRSVCTRSSVRWT